MQTHGFYQETYRGFTITSEHEGADGEITGYTVAVDSPEASEATGEDIGSMAAGSFHTLASARAFIDSEIPDAPTLAHTPEPWGISAGCDGRAVIGTFDDTERGPATDVGEVYEEANAERIVACVNGCAGIADPSAVADDLLLLRTALYMAAEDVYCEKGITGESTEFFVQAFLAEARAALAKAEGR